MGDSKLKDRIEKEMKLNNGFVSSNNYKLIDVDKNYCKLEGIITESSLNPYGIAHGGYIFGLADTASGIAARSCGRSAVTSSSSINYFRKVKGSRIVAEAICLKKGDCISNYEVSIYDGDKMVAKGMFEYFYIEK